MEFQACQVWTEYRGITEQMDFQGCQESLEHMENEEKEVSYCICKRTWKIHPSCTWMNIVKKILWKKIPPFKPLPENVAAFYGFYHPLRKGRKELYPTSVTQHYSERLWDLPLNKAELMITADWLLCSESTRAYRYSRSAIQQISYVESELNSLYCGGEITQKNSFYVLWWFHTLSSTSKLLLLAVYASEFTVYLAS